MNMKTFTVVFLFLFNFSMIASAQAQSRGGVFAAPAAAPGPVPVPPVATPPQQPPTPARPVGQAQPAQPQQEQLRIVADPATNSLIIYGTAQEFQNIKNILKELDAIPRQVLLDVLVAEVTLTDGQSLGIDYEIMRRGGGGPIFGRTFGSQGGLLTGVLSSLGEAGTNGITQFPSGFSGVVGTSNSVRALINALQTDSRAKILSSPTILATDNRPARIQVGSEEPVATGTITGAVGTVASSTTIQYRNTGRIVTIIPQVNSQGLVNLQILAEVSQRGASVRVGNVGDQFPSFDTRQAETTAIVQDGDTLAIGGIIAENVTRDRSGIPYLMDIPVLGRFFGSTSDSIRRTELVMLITPRVIRNSGEGRSVTEDFKKSLSTVRNELERMTREREKLQQRPLQERPTLPGPSSNLPVVPPAPAPTRSGVPSGPGASVIPLEKGNLPSNKSRSDVEANAVPPGNVVELGNSQRRDRAGSQGEASFSPVPVPQFEPQPAFALSFALQPNETAPAAVEKPIRRDSAPLSKRKWAVQVAALAERKDAEAMALGLRNSGYDAYVMTSQIESKTWHRVRVGQFADIGLAKQLKQTLLNTQFKHAYVAAN